MNKINKNITVFSNNNLDIIFYKGNRAALVNKRDKEIYINEINLNRKYVKEYIGTYENFLIVETDNLGYIFNKIRI